MIEYVYHYRDDDDHPITACPNCEVRWIGPEENLLVECVTYDHQSIRFRAFLWPDGELNDADNLIAGGCHSETVCNHCQRALNDIPGVVEHQSWRGVIRLSAWPITLNIDAFLASLSDVDRANLLREILAALSEADSDRLQRILNHWTR